MKRKISHSLEIHDEEKKYSKLLFKRLDNDFEQESEDLKRLDENELRKGVWNDEDDELYSAGQILKNDNPSSYTGELKSKFSKLMGTPQWAKIGRKFQNDEDDDVIFRKVGHLDKHIPTQLAKGRIELKRFPKINNETHNEGPIIKILKFHPNSSVALVAGQSGIMSLFTVGGDKNNKLHNILLKKFRFLNAHFTPDGNSAYLFSDYTKNYYVYDLIKAEAGMFSLPRSVKVPNVAELSKCGKYIAASDGFEDIHLICAKSKELLHTYKQNSKVASMVFNKDSDEIFSYGYNGNITIYNIKSSRIRHKFSDFGCVNGSVIASSECGRYLASGSAEGVVNIYETLSIDSKEPVPRHTVTNLTTKITHLAFNSSTEILALSSSYYPNAIRLLHMPSYTVFSNFPETSSKYQQISALSFSPNSGFMGLANNKNNAFLFRLNHYANY